MVVNLQLFYHDRVQLKGGVTSLVWLALLAFSLCGNARGDSTIATWRNEVALARIQAENDTSAAYKAAKRLQANLPVDATPTDRAQVLNLLSRIEIHLGQTEPAAAYARQAFDLAQQHADKIGQAEADLNVALNAINQGRIDAMTIAVTHGMMILDGVNRPDLLAEMMLRMSMMYRRHGQIDDSITVAMQTMEIARRSNDPIALAYAHQGMAFSFDQSNRLEDARSHFMLMREQARAAHMLRLEADAIIGLGRVAGHLGDLQGEERLLREGIDIFRKLGNPFSICYGSYSLAESLQRHGRTADSLALLDDIVAIYEKYPNKIGLWWTLNARSNNYQLQRRFAAASADAERAYALAKSIGFPLYLSESAKRLAALAAARGDHQRAYQLSVEADKMTVKAARENASKHMVELAERYETESKQRQITELNRRNERQAVELQKQTLWQRWLWTTLGASVVILAGTAIFLLRLRRSHRQLENAHAQLQRLQSNQQAILNAIPDLLFELGLDGRYYDCHSLRPDLLTAPLEELLGKAVIDVMPPDAAEICLSALREAHEKGTSTGKQFALPLAQGMCWFELSVARKFMVEGGEPHFIVLSRDITERKQMENRILASEREFRTLAENSPDNIIRYDLQCKLRYMNPELEKTLNVREQDLLGKTPLESYPDGEYAEYQAKIEEAISTGLNGELELTLPDTGAGVRYHHIRFVAERDSDGEIVGALAMGRDITERHHLQNTLEGREREFRTLAENSPSVIVRYDMDCHRTYVNRTYLEINSNGVNVALGSTPLEFWNVLSMTAEEYIGHLRNIMATGKPDELLVELLDQDGLMAYHTISLVPEFNENDQVMGVLSICHDVTYIKRMEAKLRKSELEFRTLAENSPEMIVRYDRDYRRIYINPAYERYTGIRLEDAWNKTPDDVWKPLMPREEYMSRLEHVMETGQPDQLLLEWYMPDGSLTSHLMHAVAEYDEAGTGVGTLVIGHNISQLKATERQLEESQHLLRKLAARSEVARENERRYLAREIHDELGQYLMALRMDVSLVGLKFGENNPALQEKTDHIIELVDSTIQVVRNVVASLRPKALDLGIVPALEWLVDEYQTRTETRCEFHVRDEDIELDDKYATAIFRIVQESLTNIGRHAEASKVDIVLERRASHYVLQVRDNGKGFDSTARKDKSFGLVGMRERALMLDGEVEISSAPGRGTVIKVSIPVNNVWSNEDEWLEY